MNRHKIYSTGILKNSFKTKLTNKYQITSKLCHKLCRTVNLRVEDYYVLKYIGHI